MVQIVTNATQKTKSWVSLPGNGDVGDPNEAKLSTGAEEDKSDPDSCAHTTFSDGFNGQMTSHMA